MIFEKVNREPFYKIETVSEEEFLRAVGQDGIRVGSYTCFFSGQTTDLGGVINTARESVKNVEQRLGIKLTPKERLSPSWQDCTHYYTYCRISLATEVDYYFVIYDFEAGDHCEGEEVKETREWHILSRSMDPTRLVVLGLLANGSDVHKVVYRISNGLWDVVAAALDLTDFQVKDGKIFERGSEENEYIERHINFLKEKYRVKNHIELSM